MLLAYPSQQIPSFDLLVKFRFLVKLQLKELSLWWVQSPSKKSAPSSTEKARNLLVCFIRKMSDTQTPRNSIWKIDFKIQFRKFLEVANRIFSLVSQRMLSQ